MFNFYHQYFLSLENSEQNPQHNHTTISFHHKEHFSKLLQSAASYDMKIINDTLYQVLFKAEHKKVRLNIKFLIFFIYNLYKLPGNDGKHRETHKTPQQTRHRSLQASPSFLPTHEITTF